MNVQGGADGGVDQRRHYATVKTDVVAGSHQAHSPGRCVPGIAIKIVNERRLGDCAGAVACSDIFGGQAPVPAIIAATIGVPPCLAARAEVDKLRIISTFAICTPSAQVGTISLIA